MFDREDIVRGGIFLDTPRGSDHGFYYSFGSKRDHHNHFKHLYRRSEKKYFPEEFKKDKPPTFDGEMKKSQDAKVKLPGMNKFFRVHDYSEKMKGKIANFSLKGK